MGIAFCIRPGRLTDGPYTSYDLNTLLRATAGERRAVLIGQGILLLPPSRHLIACLLLVLQVNVFGYGIKYYI